MQQSGNKIRILYISSNLGIGGLERVVVQLCKNLDKQLFTPAVCCIHFQGELAQELENQNIRIYNINARKPDYLAFLKIIPVIEEFKPHIVHTHNINASIDGIVASVLKKVPVKIHTDHARKFPDKIRYMLAEKAISFFIQRIIAVSEETRTNLIRFEKIKEEKIEVINNGTAKIALRTNFENHAKKNELGVAEFDFVIGTIARLEPVKGLIHLIRAVPRILQKFPNTGLIIAGQGSQRDILQQEAVSLGIQKNVIFLGPRLDICDILNLLDLFVLSSEVEGLPISLLEAMSCRRPIVATNVGGIPQAVTDGKSGILVPPFSPQSLAEAVCMMLSDDSLRRRLAGEAGNRYEQKFTVEIMVRSHQNIYLNCLNKKRLTNANIGTGRGA